MCTTSVEYRNVMAVVLTVMSGIGPSHDLWNLGCVWLLVSLVFRLIYRNGLYDMIDVASQGEEIVMPD
jgi:hypothetical protein